MKPLPKINELATHLAVGSVAALGAAIPVGLGLLGQDDPVTQAQLVLAAFGVGATVVSGAAQGILGNVGHAALAPPKQPDFQKILGNNDLHKLTGDALALVVTGFQSDPRVSQESTREALVNLAARIKEEWSNLASTRGFAQSVRSLSNEDLREWTVQSAQGKVPSALNETFWDVLLQCVLKKHELKVPEQVRQGLAQAIVKQFPHHVRQLLKEGGRAFNGHLMDWLGTIWSELKAGREENRGLHGETHRKLDILLDRSTTRTPAIVHPSLPPADWEQRVFVGRHSQKDKLEQLLFAPRAGTRPKSRVVYLAGMPGVGKTWLAEWFSEYPWGEAHRNQSRIWRYPLVFGDEGCRTTGDDLFRWLCDLAKVPFGTPETSAGLQAVVQQAGLLVHLDNVDDEQGAEAVAGFLGELRGCTALVTGRETQFGQSRGWETIPVAELSLAEAVEQLKDELTLGKNERIPSDAELESLARQLGHLPLALHLAAGHLAMGLTCAEFLQELMASGLDLLPADRADERLTANRARAILSASFELSWKAFARSAGKNKESFCAALAALGHAPLVGFGHSLSAAIAGLAADDFPRMIRLAHEFSLVTPFHDAGRAEGAWRIHPLLAKWLRTKAADSSATERMTEWFLERLQEPSKDSTDRSPWIEVHAEYAALAFWLEQLPTAQISRVAAVSRSFAMQSGPFAIWLATAKRALEASPDEKSRSVLLWLAGNVALSGGNLDEAMRLANSKIEFERGRNADREVALAFGLKADILQSRGELDEALRIRREEELPVYERLGDVRLIAITKGMIADILQSRGELDEALRIRREEELPVYERLGDVRLIAITKGMIADILQSRGELDEALRIRREEQLPVYERLGDVRSRAVTVGKIADILQSRGELDEALRIRREEELPVYERLGDVRSRAVTVGQIADILQDRGELDEALRIRREEELPVYERLGDVWSLLVGRANLALTLLARNGAGDRAEAGRLLSLALAAAEKLRIPEAGQIRDIRRRHGLDGGEGETGE